MATKAYYIPNGPVNLAPLFPTVNFSQVAEYFVQIIDSLDTVIISSPMNNVWGCDNAEDYVRVFFLNYLGGIDGIDFKLVTKEHESKSASYQKQLSHPLVRSEHSVSRFHVRGNDSFKAVTVDYYEEDMDWIDELLDSPVAWIQGTAKQGQAAMFIPVIITDRKSDKFKRDERYVYEVEIEFNLSNEKFILRN